MSVLLCFPSFDVVVSSGWVGLSDPRPLLAFDSLSSGQLLTPRGEGSDLRLMNLGKLSQSKPQLDIPRWGNALLSRRVVCNLHRSNILMTSLQYTQDQLQEYFAFLTTRGKSRLVGVSTFGGSLLTTIKVLLQ